MHFSDRIFIILASGKCITFDQLFNLVSAVKWTEYFEQNESIDVSCKCSRSRLMSPRDCQSITKKAIIENIRKNLPELPEAKKARYVAELGLTPYDAGVLTADKDISAYFETAAKGQDAKKVANWVMGDLFAYLNKECLPITKSPVSAENLGALVGLIADNTISGKIAKDVFQFMIETGKAPATIVEEKGLKQNTDTGAIEKIVDEVLAANPEQVAEIKAGKDKLKGWLVGQIMKASAGKANPTLVNQILNQKL